MFDEREAAEFTSCLLKRRNYLVHPVSKQAALRILQVNLNTPILNMPSLNMCKEKCFVFYMYANLSVITDGH